MSAQVIAIGGKDQITETSCVEIQKAFEFLAEQGFRPIHEDDDTIKFRIEGVIMRLDRQNDQSGFRLYAWVLSDIPEEHQPITYWAANYINASLPYVRASVTEDNALVVSYSIISPDISPFLNSLVYSAELLLYASRKVDQIIAERTTPKKLNS
jgi:hypothetical protein